LAISQKLDGSSRLKAPTDTTVLQLYCIEGLSVDEIVKKHGFSEGTVINRKKSLEDKLGSDLNKLRSYSDHFEKIADTLSDDRARHIDRKAAIYGNFDSEEA